MVKYMQSLISIIFVFLVWICVFTAPIFLMLYRTKFELLEKIIYSVCIGIIIVPGIYYWISYLVGSARLGLTITLFILYIVGVIIELRWKRKI